MLSPPFVPCQSPATLKTHGQVPGFTKLTALFDKVKTTTASVRGPSATATLSDSEREKRHSANTHTSRHTRTHEHTLTLPSLVPPCTETLKSLVLTLHIMSIVSKEKQFMELKHPQE